MARNEPKAKEVLQAYQRPAEISNNAIRVGRYQLEELLGNFILEETERKNQHPKSGGVGHGPRDQFCPITSLHMAD